MELEATMVPLRSEGGEAMVGCYASGLRALAWLSTDPEPDSAPLVVSGGEGLANTSWAERLDQDTVLVCCELVESRLALMRRTGPTWSLVDQVPTGGADACHLAVSPDGRWTAVAHYTSGSVALLRTPGPDAPEPPVDLLQLPATEPSELSEGQPHAHQCTWLDEQTLLVCDLGTDRIVVLAVVEESLREIGQVLLHPGFGPRHLVRRGDQFAVCGELSGELAVVRHEGPDWATGWSVVEQVPGSARRGESGATCNTPSGLVFFGDDLVVANRGCDTVARFSWADNGTLSLLAESPTGGCHPRDLVEVGGLLLVANQHSDCIVALAATTDGFCEQWRASAASPARILPDW